VSIARPLIQIRARSLLDLADLALLVIRRRPLAIGVTAALGIAPWALLNAWLIGFSGPDDASLHLLLIVVEAPLATAPLTVLLGGLMFHQRPTAKEVRQRLIAHLPSLILYQGLLRGLCVLSFVGIWLVPMRLAFLNEIVLLERGAWTKVTARSMALTAERSGELFLKGLFQVLFGLLFLMAVTFAGGQLLDIINQDFTWHRPRWNATSEALPIVAAWVAAAAFAVLNFLTYIDQRIRLEGWEVELRLKAVGRSMAEELESWSA